MRKISLQKNDKQQGFTLIEILVAAVILFTSIATVSMVYRGAFLSSEKANQYLTITGVLPSVLANIRSNIRAQGNSSDSELGQKGETWSVQYAWQAKLVEHKGAPDKLDVDTGDFVISPLKYKLWLVDLSMQFQTTNKQFQFYEVSWNDA
jgi:Tfp pilus assembly protein PilV